jgi:hypothetical protein
MNHASRWTLILAALAGLSGCATYPDRYVAAGPGGTWIDCRYEPCARDGYTYLSPGGHAYGPSGAWHGSGTVWYGSSRWYAPYRPGYTAWGFRDPWYDPWRDPWWGTGWAWAPYGHGWHGHGRSRWSWSIGYGWSSGPWTGSLWYRPWSYSSWYGPGWYGGGWVSTWHRPYRGHRPPPRERTVDWRPADGLGVANPRWLPASEEAQRIADRSRLGDAVPVRADEPARVELFERGDVEPMRTVEADDPIRLDRRSGRVVPRGAADGWIAPMPGSRVPDGERWADGGSTIRESGAARLDPPPSRFESPEPTRFERPMSQRFERAEPARFDPPPQRFESPEPTHFERPMSQRFERAEPARFAPPPPRFESPEPTRFERPMPQRFERAEPARFERAEPARFDPPPPRFESPEPTRHERPMPQRFERAEPARFDPPASTEPRSGGRRFEREDFVPN